jgi:aryl-alcohol dehydrogenase-like predicted oxidoreductase
MTELPWRPFGRDGRRVARIGLGLAALGRPAYHNVGHADDLAGRTSPEALRAACHEVLDAAWAAGVRWLDVARSYGLGEAFLREWLSARGVAPREAVVASKWGYTYVGGWRLDTERHEEKDHGLPTFLRQRDETLATLGPWLDVYAIHSATLESGVLNDPEVRVALRALREEHGVRLGATVTGARQADTIRRVCDVGLFDVVQATWNVLETSAGDALAEAHEAGLFVVVKEAMANGRLGPRGPEARVREVMTRAAERLGTTPDALALAAVLDRPWADVVLSGATTVAQLRSNLRAVEVQLDDPARDDLADLVETSVGYWTRRSALPWT